MVAATAREADIPRIALLVAEAKAVSYLHVGIRMGEAIALETEWITRNWTLLSTRLGVLRADNGLVVGVAQLRFFGDDAHLLPVREETLKSVLSWVQRRRYRQLAWRHRLPCPSLSAIVDFVAVHASQRGRSIETKLVRWAEATANERRCSQLGVSLPADDLVMRGMFAELKFHETGRTSAACWCCLRCCVGHGAFVTLFKSETVGASMGLRSTPSGRVEVLNTVAEASISKQSIVTGSAEEPDV
jgi:GNAT superfamily N-acetyltransferase